MRAIDRNASADLARQILSFDGRVRFFAHGASMAPSIRSGSEVVVEPIQRSEVSPGMIVMVSGPAGVLVHRVASAGGKLVLWGDSMPMPDGELDEFELLGRVVEIHPRSLAVRWRRWLRRLGSVSWLR